MAANGLLHTVRQRRFYGWLGSNFCFARTFLLYEAILVFIIVESQPYSQATHLQQKNGTKNENFTGSKCALRLGLTEQIVNFFQGPRSLC